MVKELTITRPRTSSTHTVVVAIYPDTNGKLVVENVIGELTGNQFKAHNKESNEFTVAELQAKLGREDYAALLRIISKLEE